MKNWYKDGYYWRHPGSGDAGDLIYNTMSRIIDMDDKSEWAYTSLLDCINLLNEGKRWPDRLTQTDTARTWLGWKLSKKLTRPQHILTRDPFIATITCAIYLDMDYQLTIPWYCYYRRVSKWKRRLETDKRPDWRKRLDYMMSTATRLRYLQDSPLWND